MQLTAHFSLAELTVSAKAKVLKLANLPTGKLLDNVKHTAAQLEKIRDFLDGAPITVTSCYRAPAVNKAVGGSPTSAHVQGLAADINAHGFTAPELAAEIVHMRDTGELDFDQVILEFPERGSGAWVHVGWRQHNANRGQVLTATRRNGKTVYLPGLRA